jgi:lysophospholipase L1-like esterase
VPAWVWDAFGRTIARRYGAVFVDGRDCYDSRYRSWDGLHMTAAGHDVVARRLFPVIARLLQESKNTATVSAR